MHLIIDPGGQVRAIYSEEIDLTEFGQTVITRASHVEPGPDGCWHVDLSPVGGPMIGPFDRRSEALNAERTWLEAHWLVPGS